MSLRSLLKTFIWVYEDLGFPRAEEQKLEMHTTKENLDGEALKYITREMLVIRITFT